MVCYHASDPELCSCIVIWNKNSSSSCAPRHPTIPSTRQRYWSLHWSVCIAMSYLTESCMLLSTAITICVKVAGFRCQCQELRLPCSGNVEQLVGRITTPWSICRHLRQQTKTYLFTHWLLSIRPGIYSKSICHEPIRQMRYTPVRWLTKIPRMSNKNYSYYVAEI